MKKILIFFALIFFFYSCKDKAHHSNMVLFENPQPINDSELNHIPIKYQGQFYENDSVFVQINQKSIIEKRINCFKFPKKDIDSLKQHFDFKNDSIFDKSSKESFPYITKNNEIQVFVNSLDTIFNLSDNNKAKRINGKLVLSKKDSIFWNATIVKIEGSKLIFNELSSEENLKRFDSLCKIKSKEISNFYYLCNPSRNEFAKILKLKHLKHEKIYLKRQ
jgi:hypothetical protein